MNRDEESMLSRIWNRRSDDLEKQLRAARPEASPELVSALTAQVGETRRRPGGAVRLAFAGGLTVVMLVGVAAVGGVSYAATAAAGAARTLEKTFAPSNARQPIVVQGLTAGSDQYRPGYGWGDDNHNHEGPPGLDRRGGGRAPALRGRPNPTDPRFIRVATTINLDEQAHLSVSVETAGGKELLLSQRRSKIGRGAAGPATKNIQYSVLIPRNGIPVDLSIPRNLLRPGVTYFIVIKATDPEGNVTTLRIPFRL
jgi:hypothetical protein